MHVVARDTPEALERAARAERDGRVRARIAGMGTLSRGSAIPTPPAGSLHPATARHGG